MLRSRANLKPGGFVLLRGKGSRCMPKKILIVDDSLSTRLTTRILIKKRTDYQVEEASNGPDALQMVAANRPDLIVMDIMMPGMDGLEVCWKLRQDKTTSSIPVILLTSKTGEEAARAGFAKGCKAYLNKPLVEKELLDTLQTYLEN
jgi:CheY-like chemotaxis protein